MPLMKHFLTNKHIFLRESAPSVIYEIGKLSGKTISGEISSLFFDKSFCGTEEFKVFCNKKMRSDRGT